MRPATVRPVRSLLSAPLVALLLVVPAVLASGLLVVQRAQAARSVPTATESASAPAPTAVAVAPSAPVPALTLKRVAPRPATPRPATRRPANDPWARFGFDISWPQCGQTGPVLPPALGSTAIVGITNGRPFSTNRCLSQEWRWALGRTHPGAYINLDFPTATVDLATYGAASVRDALARARSAGLSLQGAWLDVEVSNHWSSDQSANTAVIRGAVDAVQAAGLQPGIYSTPLDWVQITGGATLSLPVWQALSDGRKIAQGCDGAGFGGHRPDLVQAVFSAAGHNVDGDLICSAEPALTRILG